MRTPNWLAVRWILHGRLLFVGVLAAGTGTAVRGGVLAMGGTSLLAMGRLGPERRPSGLPWSDLPTLVGDAPLGAWLLLAGMLATAAAATRRVRRHRATLVTAALSMASMAGIVMSLLGRALASRGAWIAGRFGLGDAAFPAVVFETAAQSSLDVAGATAAGLLLGAALVFAGAPRHERWPLATSLLAWPFAFWGTSAWHERVPDCAAVSTHAELAGALAFFSVIAAGLATTRPSAVRDGRGLFAGRWLCAVLWLGVGLALTVATRPTATDLARPPPMVGLDPVLRGVARVPSLATVDECASPRPAVVFTQRDGRSAVSRQGAYRLPALGWQDPLPDRGQLTTLADTGVRDVDLMVFGLRHFETASLGTVHERYLCAVPVRLSAMLDADRYGEVLAAAGVRPPGMHAAGAVSEHHP